MEERQKARVIRLSKERPVCPPKHVKTDAYTMVGEMVGAKNFVLFNVEIHPGGEAQLDTHPGSEHCYFVISGSGDATVEGESFQLKPGDCLWIPPDSVHGIKPLGDETLRFIVVTAPPPQKS